MTDERELARRDLLKAGAATIALLGTSCGYLLYPERKGRSSGSIDVGVLVVDLLWLLPGIIPGVICLAVDYSTGCIYRGSSVAREDERWPDEHLGRAEVTLDGVVVARSEIDRQRRARLRLIWDRDVDAEAVCTRGRLTFERSSGSTAVAGVSDLI